MLNPATPSQRPASHRGRGLLAGGAAAAAAWWPPEVTPGVAPSRLDRRPSLFCPCGPGPAEPPRAVARTWSVRARARAPGPQHDHRDTWPSHGSGTFELSSLAASIAGATYGQGLTQASNFKSALQLLIFLLAWTYTF